MLFTRNDRKKWIVKPSQNRCRGKGSLKWSVEYVTLVITTTPPPFTSISSSISFRQTNVRAHSLFRYVAHHKHNSTTAPWLSWQRFPRKTVCTGVKYVYNAYFTGGIIIQDKCGWSDADNGHCVEYKMKLPFANFYLALVVMCWSHQWAARRSAPTSHTVKRQTPTQQRDEQKCMMKKM